MAFIKLLVTFGLVWIIGRNVKLQVILVRLQDTNLLTMFFVVAVLAAVPILHALRWRLVLQTSGYALNFSKVFQAVMIGYFFNQTLPSSVGGDAYRVWYIYRTGMHLGEAFSSVIVDRLIALTALLMICAFSMPWIFNLTGGGQASWAVVVLVVAGVMGLGFVLMLERLPARWNHWRVVRGLVRLGAHLRKVFVNFRIAVTTIVISALGHIVTAILVAVIGFAVRIPLSLTDCLLLVPLVMLIAMVPISIAGWGVREGAMVVAFGFIGVAPADAFLLSLLFGLALLVASLPGGLLWLAGRRHSKLPSQRFDGSPPFNQG
ncbi:MAG TPA: lysylphosphatidylglycerol synthase transmembrane domain-containing protein [Sulfuricella sp.]|nr:lysylphosphatidylglycerol synthase transmembrane domain-containing protein [Sulfuricella sp.]